jgi:hypothetical protein
MSSAANKRSRDTDEKIKVSKRVKEHDPAEKIGQQAAASETFRRAPLIDGTSVWHDEIVKISTKDFLQVCNTVLLFYDYDLYVRVSIFCFVFLSWNVANVCFLVLLRLLGTFELSIRTWTKSQL